MRDRGEPNAARVGEGGRRPVPPWRGLSAFVLLLAVAALPLALVDYPPLVDYPNHLARQHILGHLDQSPDLQRYYERQRAVLPNTAMDAVVPPAARRIGPARAGKLFVAVTFALLVSGVLALNRAVWKTWDPVVLVAFFFLYNRAFLWGFLNYLFGVGLSLWLFALWIAVEERAFWARAILFAPLALLLFFAHLYALGIWGLCIAGRLVDRHRQGRSGSPWREVAVAAVPFVLPAVLLFFFSPTTAADSAFAVRYNFSQKPGALLQPLNNYSRVLDAATLLVLAGLGALGIARGRVVVHSSCAIAAGLLFGCFLVMPETFLTVQCVDVRMPNAIAFFLAAGCRVRRGGAQGGAARRIAAALLVLFAVRTAVVAVHWRASREAYAPYIAAFEKLPAGSTLFTAIGRPSAAWRPFPVPVAHIACLAVIHRDAFVPSLFASEGQQPVLFKGGWRSTARKWSQTVYGGGSAPDWHACASAFEYLLVSGGEDFVRGMPEMDLLFTSGAVRLYRSDAR